jgi:hypothetical protein
MMIYLARDPENDRITAQEQPFTRADFPPGLRGEGWETRTAEIPKQTWTKMLRANFSSQAQDRIHVAWWESENA